MILIQGKILECTNRSRDAQPRVLPCAGPFPYNTQYRYNWSAIGNNRLIVRVRAWRRPNEDKMNRTISEPVAQR